MSNFVIYILAIIYFCYFINNKIFSDFELNHRLFLKLSFKLLNNKNNIKCKNSSKLACISQNLDKIINAYNFKSDYIFFGYKKPHPLYFNPFNITKTNIFNKSKIELRKFKLKVYGFKNVILSQEGSIHSDCWNITTKGGCKCDFIPSISLNKAMYCKYDKVISITHHWCNAVYHSIGECLPKLGYYIPELLNDPSIKIHTYRSASVKYLKLLGFNNSRIVYGNIYVKRLLSLEKGGCGFPPSVLHLHYLRKYLRKKIKSKPKYHIVMIKRYGKRDISNFDDVYNSLKNRYRNKEIIIFYPNTTFKNTLNYFKYSKLIVAPHGAGLTNIIISYNCKIIEFVCSNLFYSGLARQLRLEYYGIYEKIVNKKFIVNITTFMSLIQGINI